MLGMIARHKKRVCTKKQNPKLLEQRPPSKSLVSRSTRLISFKKKNGCTNPVFSAIILFMPFSEIVTNAIQRNFRRNCFIAKIALNGFFPLIAINLSKIRFYCNEWDTSDESPDRSWSSSHRTQRRKGQ